MILLIVLLPGLILYLIASLRTSYEAVNLIVILKISYEAINLIVILKISYEAINLIVILRTSYKAASFAASLALKEPFLFPKIGLPRIIVRTRIYRASTYNGKDLTNYPGLGQSF